MPIGDTLNEYLSSNGDGTYTDPATPGVVYDSAGNVVSEPITGTQWENGVYSTPRTQPVNTAGTTDTATTGVNPTDWGPVNPYGTETTTTAPVKPASVVATDAQGNWYDALGKIIGNAVTGLVSTAINPAVQNLASGGLLNDAAGMMKGAVSGIQNVAQPDLMALIPQLQLQVQQGTMTPAQASAAMQTVQGKMSPASYQAALAQVQGKMEAAKGTAATGSVIGKMTPAQYNIVKAVQQGKMTPVQAAAAVQKDSEMKGVNTDLASIEGMRTALGQLSTIAENKGMTDADRAQFQQAMNLANSNAASQRQAQIQQLQMQGNAGTGSELAARLAGGQQIANAGSAAGATLATNAQARALDAIKSGLAGNKDLNAQLFEQQAAKAQAQDLVNNFNAQAKQAANLQNATAGTAANLTNFTTANDIERANAAAGNVAGQYNAGNVQAANLAGYNKENEYGLQNLANQQATNIANTGYSQAANLQNFLTAQDVEKQNAAAANTASGYNAGNIQASNLANFNTANTVAGQNQANQQATNIWNATAGNAANLTNFNAAQDIAKTNVGIMNTQAGLPLSTAQQQYTNKVGQATAAANAGLYGGKALGDMGTSIANKATAAGSSAVADTVPKTTGTTGSTGSTIQNAAKDVGAIGTIWNAGKSIWDTLTASDENLKTDKHELSNDDIDSMMASLTGYKYRYKGPRTNPEQIGVMAQDMERGMGSVVDTPAGKMIQPDQALGKALAVLANNNARIRKLEGK